MPYELLTIRDIASRSDGQLSPELCRRLIVWRTNRDFLDDAERQKAHVEDMAQTLEEYLLAVSMESGCDVDELRDMATSDETRRRAASLDMSGPQRLVASLTFSNIVWFLAAIMISSAVLELLSHYLMPLIRQLGPTALKIAAWGFTLTCICLGVSRFRKKPAGIFMSLTGLMLFPTCCVFATRTYYWEHDWERFRCDANMHVMRVATVVAFTAVAICHRSRLISFLAVLSFCIFLYYAWMCAPIDAYMGLTKYGDLHQMISLILATGVVLVADMCIWLKERTLHDNAPTDGAISSSWRILAPEELNSLFGSGSYFWGPLSFSVCCLWLVADRRMFYNTNVVFPQAAMVVLLLLTCCIYIAFAYLPVFKPQFSRYQQLSGTFLALLLLTKAYVWMEDYCSAMAKHDARVPCEIWVFLALGILFFCVAWISKLLPKYFLCHL